MAKQNLIMENKPTQIPAAKITQIAINLLTLHNYEVWRQNNLAVKGRAFIGKKGIGDISGYCKQFGWRVECEVKSIGDKLSDEQVEFMTNLHNSSGCAFIAHQLENKVVISRFIDYFEVYQKKNNTGLQQVKVIY